MLKAPVAGRVKTRLGAEIGMARAVALFRVLTDRTIAEAMKAPQRTILAVDPPGAVHATASFWPPGLPRIIQGEGDLGARMKRVFAGAPVGPVIIIGADAPGLRARHIKAAFSALRSADAVFGPAADGGYWLVGLARKRSAPDLFDGVRWSTKHALADTLKTLPDDFSVQMLEMLNDVDEAADLPNIGPAAAAH